MSDGPTFDLGDIASGALTGRTRHCTCAQLDVSSALHSHGHNYVPGLKDPRCPLHGNVLRFTMVEHAPDGQRFGLDVFAPMVGKDIPVNLGGHKEMGTLIAVEVATGGITATFTIELPDGSLIADFIRLGHTPGITCEAPIEPAREA